MFRLDEFAGLLSHAGGHSCLRVYRFRLIIVSCIIRFLEVTGCAVLLNLFSEEHDYTMAMI